ncbi:hypothetical protein WKV44_05635 [Spirochaetia bacterium 38H-sp]|uniref:Phospholipase C/D domain-containing protein n=1 Tax=Rarispira pelagica TaxID=3141764 RepID=A0ABU9UCZ6_9SPIR
MPSHITHALIVWDAYGRVFGPIGDKKEISDSPQLRALTLGAQGPDIFFHNRRTMPSGISMGSLAHRRDYGLISEAMLRRTAESKVQSEELMYVAGWLSHSVVDRIFHPYVIYRSGWFSSKSDATRRYIRWHSMLERIMDRILLESLRGENVSDYDMYALCSIGDTIPLWLKKLLVYSFKQAYREVRRDKKVSLRVANAYADTMAFYRDIHPSIKEKLSPYLAKRPTRETKKRSVSLLHPPFSPDFDVLNLEHSIWYSPFCKEKKYTSSVMELYETAVKKVSDIFSFIKSRKIEDIPQEILDTSNLSSGEERGRQTPLYSSPFPMDSYIEKVVDYYEKYDNLL